MQSEPARRKKGTLGAVRTTTSRTGGGKLVVSVGSKTKTSLFQKDVPSSSASALDNAVPQVTETAPSSGLPNHEIPVTKVEKHMPPVSEEKEREVSTSTTEAVLEPEMPKPASEGPVKDVRAMLEANLSNSNKITPKITKVSTKNPPDLKKNLMEEDFFSDPILASKPQKIQQVGKDQKKDSTGFRLFGKKEEKAKPSKSSHIIPLHSKIVSGGKFEPLLFPGASRGLDELSDLRSTSLFSIRPVNFNKTDGVKEAGISRNILNTLSLSQFFLKQDLQLRKQRKEKKESQTYLLLSHLKLPLLSRKVSK